MDNFVARMTGGDADFHEIPAYEGSQSIYGMARSILIVGNLIGEGKLRKKDFKREFCKINLRPAKEGSFLVEFLVSLPPTTQLAGIVVGAAASGVIGNLTYDILKYCYARLTGDKVEENVAVEQAIDNANATPERLLEAMEPSARIAHTMINYGVLNINIENPREKNSIKLNNDTKKYIWSSAIDKTIKTKLFSVSKFDPNSRNGTLFDFEEARPISFQLDKHADETSIETIIWSQSEYTRKRLLLKNTDTGIAMKYTSLNAHDGRAKKISSKRQE